MSVMKIHFCNVLELNDLLLHWPMLEFFGEKALEGTLSGRVGPVVARSTEDREVRGSNPTLA